MGKSTFLADEQLRALARLSATPSLALVAELPSATGPTDSMPSTGNGSRATSARRLPRFSPNELVLHQARSSSAVTI